MAREGKGSVEWLKAKLYSRKDAPVVSPEERTPLSQSGAQAPVGWSDIKTGEAPKPAAPLNFMGKNTPSAMPFAAKFFMGSVIFFLAAAGLAAYIFFVGGNTISPQNIDISVVAPSVIDGGKQATLQILIDNRNRAALQLADLVINYPDGTRDPANPGQPLSHERQTIGTIQSGEQIKRTADAIFYGQEGVPQKIGVVLEYSIPGSNAIFEKDAEAEFTVGSSPVSISVNAPSEIIAGQRFSLDVEVKSNATTPIDNLVIQGQYPFGFSVTSATPPADAGSTLWRLGTMAPGTSQTIHLVGQIDGQDGDQRVFRFLAGQDADQTNTSIKVPFLTVPQTLTVRRPFVTATIALNNQTGKSIATPAGQPVQGSVTWQNNLSDTVKNVELKLSLSGPMLDRASISSQNGFYQSSDNTITWTKDQVADLASVAPGGSGTLPFSFTTVSPGTGGTIYTNPTVDLALTISGVRPGQDSVPETVTSAAQTQATLVSVVTLNVQATHFQGAFANTGPMPPVAEGQTSYAILWTVKNSSNAIANATVSAVLPPYVAFVQAQSGSGISFDAASRTVTWNLGDLKPGVGYSAPARTASFQVLFSPSSSQVGQSPALTGAAMLSGEDRFAQTNVGASAAALTTMLVGDSGFNSSMGVVAPK